MFYHDRGRLPFDLPAQDRALSQIQAEGHDLLACPVDYSVQYVAVDPVPKSEAVPYSPWPVAWGRALTGLVAGLLALWGIGAVFCSSMVHLVWREDLQQFIPEPGSHVRWHREGWALTRFGADGMAGRTEVDTGALSVLLWGDSFVEALQVSDDKKMAAVATQIFTRNGYEVQVLGVGGSGQSVADYLLAMPAYARRFSDIQAQVILVSNLRDLLPDQPTQERARFFSQPTFRIEPDPKAGSGRVSSQRNKRVDALRLSILRKARRKAAGSLGNLRLAPGPVPKPIDEPASMHVGDDFRYIARRLKAASDKPMVLLYCPEVPRFEQGVLVFDDLDAALAERCATAFAREGIRIVNLAEPFAAAFREDRTLARGFANSYPTKGHLNPAGHRLVARALYDALTSPSDALHTD